MLLALRAKWRTTLALLIAVATAWMFCTVAPTSPPPGTQTEVCCTPEVHDAPFISKQEDSNDRAPSGRTDAVNVERLGGPPFAELLCLGPAPTSTKPQHPRERLSAGIYPRGPPLAV